MLLLTADSVGVQPVITIQLIHVLKDKKVRLRGETSSSPSVSDLNLCCGNLLETILNLPIPDAKQARRI